MQNSVIQFIPTELLVRNQYRVERETNFSHVKFEVYSAVTMKAAVF
jgi:hypothetical protein